MPVFRSLLEALSVLLARTLSLGEDAAHVLARPSAILEPPTAEGSLRFGQGGGSGEEVLRLYARVAAADKAPLELDARRRVNEAFAAHGIRVPRAAMDVRLTMPSDSGSVEVTRKESVA